MTIIHTHTHTNTKSINLFEQNLIRKGVDNHTHTHTNTKSISSREVMSLNMLS